MGIGDAHDPARLPDAKLLRACQVRVALAKWAAERKRVIQRTHQQRRCRPPREQAAEAPPASARGKGIGGERRCNQRRWILRDDGVAEQQTGADGEAVAQLFAAHPEQDEKRGED